MIIAWPLVQPFLKSNWKLVLAVAAILAAFTWHKLQVNGAWYAGRAALVLEQTEEAKRRNADAQAADAIARQCSADPACRLLDDGNRRD